MTRRTVLLPVAAHDLPTLSTLWNRAGVLELLLGGDGLASERSQELLDVGMAAVEAGLGWWLVYPWSNGPALGCVGLLPQAAQAPAPGRRGDRADAVLAFGPEAWAQGFAHEAAMELVRHAVHDLVLQRLSLVSGLQQPLLEGLLDTLGFELRLEADAGHRRLRLYDLNAAAARIAAGAVSPPPVGRHATPHREGMR